MNQTTSGLLWSVKWLLWWVSFSWQISSTFISVFHSRIHPKHNLGTFFINVGVTWLKSVTRTTSQIIFRLLFSIFVHEYSYWSEAAIPQPKVPSGRSEWRHISQTRACSVALWSPLVAITSQSKATLAWPLADWTCNVFDWYIQTMKTLKTICVTGSMTRPVLLYRIPKEK